MSTDLQALYAELNAEHFDSELPGVRIFGVLPSGSECGLGGQTVGPNIDGEYAIFLSPALPEVPTLKCPYTVRSILLHEIVHAATMEKCGIGHEPHGAEFKAECERIAVAQGWDEVEDCLDWPNAEEM